VAPLCRKAGPHLTGMVAPIDRTGGVKCPGILTPEHFKDFYRTKGAEKLKDRVDHYKDMIGVKPQGIRVMELKNRWASCSDNNILNFHWKLIMAPMTVIDYVVVHEMAHFLYPNHNESFWNVVDKVLPDFLERKNWLREKGAALDI
jgi:predicted metal-dependent hydrolase